MLSGQGTISGSPGSYTHTGTITWPVTLTGTGTITSNTNYWPNGTIATTGTLSGQGTETGTTTYVTNGTIATTGTLSGQGTETGTTTYNVTGSVSHTQPFTGQGTMTVTTVPATTYDVPTGYTLSWPAASNVPVTPDGYLLYFVHNGGTPTLVPGVYPASPIVGTTYQVVPGQTPSQPYQPTVSSGDYWYVTSIANGIESTTKTLTAVVPASEACAPVNPPATYIPPPANFQVTLPACNAAGQYPAQLGVRLSWNPVPNASGYTLYSVHSGVQTLLSGMSPTSPWPVNQYPPSGNPYDPNLVLNDYWRVYSVFNGVESPTPAFSAPITATQVCQPAVNS
jgi:hypothetical protein